VANVPAPKIALDYWRLPANARLRDVVLAVRNDEAGHRDVNHGFAEQLRPLAPVISTRRA
jgi:ubiquinol oxidase